ncbi:Low-density lipoprotein receptor domain class A [Ancylostoma ceylanicum]|uniref:Low-density lipoprotein receptor domain class A n=2 Tax=Ancylostoma ceylanicum TaxID=53326 RepID=A0A0D6LYT1_9BILA|nr:Low-density lipoprotein receptor domain class A [Ancylostoma ceylanicum]
MQQMLLIALSMWLGSVSSATEDRVLARFMCDGNIDCGDHSDEDPALCSKPPGKIDSTKFHYGIRTRKCPTTWFFCVDGSNCIASRYVCDNFKDCRDGSDEAEFCHGWNGMKRNASDRIVY